MAAADVEALRELYAQLPVFNVWRFEGGKVVEFHTTRHEQVALQAANVR